MVYTSTQNILIYIRQVMLVRGITVKELAHRLNKSQGAVSMMFKQDNITLDTLNDVCKALNATLNIDIGLEYIPPNMYIVGDDN